MDAGLAALGQGWPIAAGPRSRTGARVCRALARHRTPGARALGYLGPGGVPCFQVTRCKSETIGRRYRSNGYTPNPNATNLKNSITAEAGFLWPGLDQCKIWLRNSLVRSFCGLSKKSFGAACSTISPLSMKITRLATVRAKPISWV